MGGFSYRGKNIDEFGDIYYAPRESERGEYALPFDVSEQKINGRDGAYYYDNHVEPREFTLRCFYENLTQQNKEDIIHWFGRNTKGQLVFDERDWVYYDVIPDERIQFEDYRGMTCNGLRYNGILTIHLKAYCPFGKLMANSIQNDCPLVGSAIVGIAIVGQARMGADDETIVLMTAQMPSPPYTQTDSMFYVYNPGTERTPLRIRIAGTAESGTITNTTNGTTCTIMGMTDGNTTDVNKYVSVDGDTGRVTLVGVFDTQLAFEMHDYGYIWLDPSIPFARDIDVSYTSGSTTITSDGAFYRDLAGKYVYLHNEWHKIASYTDANTMVLTDAMDATGTEITQIVNMNELVFDGFALTKLEMDYTPRMR